MLPAALAVALAAIGACDDGPTRPRRVANPRALADTVFGAGAVGWFTPDSVGAWTMRPEPDGPRVYFERDMELTATGKVAGPARLVAIDRETGALLWHRPFISAHNAAVAGDVVGAVWGSLPMFDRGSGTPALHFTYGSTSLASNVVSDGVRFYVASHDGHALAVDPVTGAAAWDADLAGGPSTVGFGVALSGDALAVALKHFRAAGTQRDSGIVAVVDRASGAVRWRVVLPGSVADPGIVEPPAIVGGLVIVVTQGHDVRAFDLATGALRWQADASFAAGDGEYASNGLAACEGLVIVPTGDLGLAALDTATGAVRWRLPDLRDGSLRGVECSHGTVLTLGSRLRVLDALTGAARAVYPITEPGERSDFRITSATRDDRWLYVGTTHGYARVRAP